MVIPVASDRAVDPARAGAHRAGGNQDEAVRQFRRWAQEMRAIAAILVVAFWDMVTKPGL